VPKKTTPAQRFAQMFALWMAQPQPSSSHSRDAAPNPFDDPQFTPVGLVERIVAKYVTLKSYVAVIYALWICFTHVYTKFSIAPRVALTSEGRILENQQV
jgi:hypothetical protein